MKMKKFIRTAVLAACLMVSAQSAFAAALSEVAPNNDIDTAQLITLNNS
jgi:opacity protein-like surface antigen